MKSHCDFWSFGGESPFNVRCESKLDGTARLWVSTGVLALSEVELSWDEVEELAEILSSLAQRRRGKVGSGVGSGG